jgi:hypothetical protein
MCRASRLDQEGRSCVVTFREPGLRWTRQRRARKCGQGGLLSVSPRLRVDERRCQVRLASILPAMSTTPGDNAVSSEPCVRQNRVVLAVVATVKPWRRRHSRQPARCPRLSLGRGRPTGTRLPGEHGISRKATAQGRPSDWLHLYAAVRFPCATLSRSGPRVPAGTRPSLRPLGQEGGEISKARAQCAARMRKRVCESNASWKNDAAASCSVIASGAKQSSPPPPRDSGLLRSARNDDGEAGARVSPGLRRARGRDGSRSSDGRGCARSWCRAVRSPRSRPGRDTAGT